MHHHASSHRSTNHISTGLVLKYTSTQVRLDTVSTDTTCYSCTQSVSMPTCTQPYLGYSCIRAYQVPTYLDPRSSRHGSITSPFFSSNVLVRISVDVVYQVTRLHISIPSRIVSNRDRFVFLHLQKPLGEKVCFNIIFHKRSYAGGNVYFRGVSLLMCYQ